MRSRLMLAAASLIGALAPVQPGVAAAPSGMVPGGSYLDSCREIVFDAAANLLYATCTHRTPEGLISAKGEDVRSSGGFDVTPCLENSIFNDDGNLYCLAKAPWGHDHAIPEGSYRASCTRSRVLNNVLIAECDDSSDETRNSEVNLNECRWGGDISNANGSLRCEQLAAGEAPAVPLIKPAIVAPAIVSPGVVKPVTIAPLVPAPSEDSTAPPEKKKRERKRRSGERG